MSTKLTLTEINAPTSDIIGDKMNESQAEIEKDIHGNTIVDGGVIVPEVIK